MIDVDALIVYKDKLEARLLEATAELIYLRLYGKDGARWEANDSKKVWREKAKEALRGIIIP